MAARAEEVVQRMRATLERFALVAPGDTVLAAVSGGADSVCLLHVLRELSVPLEVAHFDHLTRDGASTEDARFVERLAADLGLPFHLERRAVESEAAASDLSFEEYARDARYEFLLRTARARGCAVVATGHHADDQAETVLMRVVRGASPSGLAGIPVAREESGVRIARPLLYCPREDILAYLAARGIAFREDASNADRRHVRNRVRHELLPLLEREYNPRVRDALTRLAETQRDEDDLLTALAARLTTGCVGEDGAIAREVFAEFHPALQRRALLLTIWRLGIACPFDRIEAAREFIRAAPVGKRFDLGGGLTLRNGRDTTVVLRDESEAEADDSDHALEIPGETAAFGRRFIARALEARPADPLAAYCHPARQVFDADALGAPVTVRRRRPGDRFTPFGAPGSKKLKDYFCDAGVPAAERGRQLLLVAGERIAWVVGKAISAHVAVTDETRRLVEIEVTDASE